MQKFQELNSNPGCTYSERLVNFLLCLHSSRAPRVPGRAPGAVLDGVENWVGSHQGSKRGNRRVKENRILDPALLPGTVHSVLPF